MSQKIPITGQICVLLKSTFYDFLRFLNPLNIFKTSYRQKNLIMKVGVLLKTLNKIL